VSTRIIHESSEIDWDRPGKHSYLIAFHLDSSWGYSLVPLTVINGHRVPESGTKPEGLAVFGGTHGNEWEGQIATKRLCHELDPQNLAGQVVLMPQLSASACAANTRLSPLDNVNMNRAFPGSRTGSISYRIAHFVTSCIFPRVQIVVDLHSGGLEGGFALCASIHSVASPQQYTEMVRAAKLFDTPFVFVYSSQMASGLLSDEAEAAGKIAIGGEFGFGETVSRKGVRHAVEGVKNLLRSYGHLSGPVQRINVGDDTQSKLVSALEMDAYVPAPRDGIWEPAVDLGDQVPEGALIGYLHDFGRIDEPPLEIRSTRAGFVLMMHAPASCTRGVTLYVIAQEVQ
jgi:predicted deacylase